MVQQEAVSVGTLRAITKAFNAHDLDAIMEFFADDCSLDMPRGPEPWGQRFTGKVAVLVPLEVRHCYQVAGRDQGHGPSDVTALVGYDSARGCLFGL